MDRRFYKIALFTFAILFLLGVSITFAQPVIVQPRDEQPLSNGGEASHFINPPTFDSGWLNISNQCGQYFDIVHNLNTTDVVVDIAGKQAPSSGAGHQINLGSANILPGWNHTYDNIGYSPWILKTIDGGYIFNGFWKLYKMDSDGNLEWSKTIPGGIEINSIASSSDGGYALAGASWDVNSWDFWVAKTNSTGDVQWSTTYGLGNREDQAWGLIETSDGGYAVVGTKDLGGGGSDCWLIKTNATGDFEWDHTYNQSQGEVAYSVVENTDGSLVMACESAGDLWLIKVDSSGNHQWNETYGGCLYPHIVKTSEGGYAIAGSSSYGVSADFRLIKTDFNGTIQWEKAYGGADYDYPSTLIQTSDNGYAILGVTSSFGAGGDDMLLVETDSFGTLQWNRTYGDSGDEAGFSIAETIDERLIIAGMWGSDGIVIKTELETGSTGLSRTGLDSDKIALYRGSADPYWNYVKVRIWIIKEPTWVYGDIDMDGDVDIFDLVKACGNYGQTYYGIATLSGGVGLVALGGVKRFKSKKENT